MRVAARRAALGLLVLALAGCLTTNEVLVDRPWTLVEIDGVPRVNVDVPAGMGFGTDGRFWINTGCRSGGGSYHPDGNRILLDAEILQPSPCDDAMAAQDAILAGAIEGRPQFDIDTQTGRLRLTTEAGQILLFETP